jgi:hypothetical protein
MRPDAQQAMRDALVLGPDYCPPHLIAGQIDAVVRGLKAHANTIAHARHVAIEESYPRTRSVMGSERFHDAAKVHLADPAVLRLPLGLIGLKFAERLTGASRDLASIEWAWLISHGAADATPFDLAAINRLNAEEVAKAPIVRHPAAQLVKLTSGRSLQWEGGVIASGYVLITRPSAEVLVTGIDPAAAAMMSLLDRLRPLGDLLERDAQAATALVTAGALMLFPEIMP